MHGSVPHVGAAATALPWHTAESINHCPDNTEGGGYLGEELGRAPLQKGETCNSSWLLGVGGLLQKLLLEIVDWIFLPICVSAAHVGTVPSYDAPICTQPAINGRQTSHQPTNHPPPWAASPRSSPQAWAPPSRTLAAPPGSPQSAPAAAAAVAGQPNTAPECLPLAGCLDTATPPRAPSRPHAPKEASAPLRSCASAHRHSPCTPRTPCTPALPQRPKHQHLQRRVRKGRLPEVASHGCGVKLGGVREEGDCRVVGSLPDALVRFALGGWGGRVGGRQWAEALEGAARVGRRVGPGG